MEARNLIICRNGGYFLCISSCQCNKKCSAPSDGNLPTYVRQSCPPLLSVVVVVGWCCGGVVVVGCHAWYKWSRCCPGPCIQHSALQRDTGTVKQTRLWSWWWRASPACSYSSPWAQLSSCSSVAGSKEDPLNHLAASLSPSTNQQPWDTNNSASISWSKSLISRFASELRLRDLEFDLSQLKCQSLLWRQLMNQLKKNLLL